MPYDEQEERMQHAAERSRIRDDEMNKKYEKKERDERIDMTEKEILLEILSLLRNEKKEPKSKKN